MMLGQTRQPSIVDGDRIGPLLAHGVKLFRSADLAGRQADGDARADAAPDYPAVSTAGGVGELDFLIVDLPPGTGDVVISLVQTVPLTGAIVVSTPSDVSLQDARKAIEMFGQVKVEVIGIVENMSHFTCPHCQQVIDIFSSGGAERLAQQYGLEFLGSVELDPEIRSGGDRGCRNAGRRGERDRQAVLRDGAEGRGPGRADCRGGRADPGDQLKPLQYLI